MYSYVVQYQYSHIVDSHLRTAVVKLIANRKLQLQLFHQTQLSYWNQLLSHGIDQQNVCVFTGLLFPHQFFPLLLKLSHVEHLSFFGTWNAGLKFSQNIFRYISWLTGDCRSIPIGGSSNHSKYNPYIFLMFKLGSKYSLLEWAWQ